MDANVPTTRGCYQFRTNGNSELQGSILLDIRDTAGLFGTVTIAATC